MDKDAGQKKKQKHVKLEDATKQLLNKAKAKILNDNPANDWVTDDETIRTALEHYLNGAK